MTKSKGQRLGLMAQAEQIASEFNLSSEHVRRVTKHLVRQLKDGLANERPWQLPAYLQSIPTGTEKGQFLAVDLGGSNCRICMAELHGDSTFTVLQSKHRVPPSVMVNQSYLPLFDFIARHIAEFVDAHLDPNSRSPYKLGFTFSFTCEQESLNGGRLIHWDKGWDIPQAVGRDPCVMLQEAINRMGIPVQVTVLANDSVGTLLTRSYCSGRGISTLGAVIFGTGTNAAYVEKLSNVRRLKNTKANADGIMVINSEWGSLDDEMKVLPRTPLDDELDSASVDPGFGMLEKRVSGLYLGELLRLAILKLLRASAFDMTVGEQSCLFRRDGIDSSLLSHLAILKSIDSAVRLLQDTLSAKSVSNTDAESIKLIAEAIARRAARLSGASLAAVIIQSGRLETSSRKFPSRVPSRTTSISPYSLQSFYSYAPLLLRHLLDFVRLLCKRPSWMLPKHPPDADSTPLPGDIIDIGADGSVIESYPTFEAEMRGAMKEVAEIGPAGEQRVRITLTKDGSGVGAALMAHAASLAETGRPVNCG
ncbi:hexokinase [Penicillium brasilianum]|uniref:Phosphotransferase n=1 Tax=Penicillium brasilianum TaxID=104259 RepID=A0A1S9REN2_PENBI|nr:hexokinase [Penicillium brasilianum]